MSEQLLSEYRFKFYLNASHSILVGGTRGTAHPHTWELAVNLLAPSDRFVEFRVFEEAVAGVLRPYQNTLLNECAPFDTVEPTLENIARYFAGRFRSTLEEAGGVLVQMEASERPTRSYILSFRQEPEYREVVQLRARETASRMLNHMLDRILEDGQD